MRFILMILGLIVVLALLIWGLARGFGPTQAEIQASVSGIAPLEVDTSQFERAFTVQPITFPKDFGPHPGFQTEWWYYTGNLADESGNRYGFQLTFFRRGLAPQAQERASAWGSNQVYFAHFTITDAANDAFYPHERFSRGGADLAGAQASPYRVWLENWQALELESGQIKLQASEGDVSLNLTLTPEKPPALQGNAGFSPKSETPGNASYYYSQTRNRAEGTIETPAGTAEVQGNVWKDHEWSTSALGAEAIGWDWFSLTLDDGRDVMFFQIRQEDGSIEPISGGTLIEADGTTRYLPLSAVKIETLDTWQSEASGAAYPAKWRFTIPGENIDLTLTPLVKNQELQLSFTYWEGAVKVAGSHSGYGYVEMTGYAGSMQGQF